MTDSHTLLNNCNLLLIAYETGKLGQTVMPEDSQPNFLPSQLEQRLAYFTLPMALNYQRDSYKLWVAALATYNDDDTNFVFDVALLNSKTDDELRAALSKYRLALQPNKHINTWRTISRTIFVEFGSISNFITKTNGDFLQLKDLVQRQHKKGFPYISGPKIFNYWSYILTTYGNINLKNRLYIEIAPDTHITQCSVKLGVISKEEAVTLSKD